MKRVKKIRIRIWLLIVAIALIAAGFISPLKLTEYDLTFDYLPEEFDGYKIVQISDFHCKDFGENEEDLIELVKEAEPDLIVMTGDIVDEDHDTENALLLLEGFEDIAPVYYVTGNHEYYTGAPFDEFLSICRDTGTHVLMNSSADISKGDSKIILTGMDFTTNPANYISEIGYGDASYFNILLYHDSSKFNFLSSFDYDLIFAGHIHGGLVRLPFLGGVFGSDYRFFPEYDCGVFYKKTSCMVSSAGLGDARIPRWNNPREVVLVTLHSSQSN